MTSKPSIIMGHKQWYVQKGSEHRLCQKTNDSERKSISNLYPTKLLNKSFSSRLSRWQMPWIIDMPPEVVEQLLDILSFDREGATNLFVPQSYGPWWWRVLNFDVMFPGSLFTTRIGKGWRSNHECQHWTFYSSDLIHDAYCRVQNLANFFTS